MTEREKMEQGLPFRDADPELQRPHVQNLHGLHEYNGCDPLETERRAALLREITPNAGEGFYAQSPFHCDYGFHIFTGNE